jgi:glycosyltransferase involved in cell wall biosynthesis
VLSPQDSRLARSGEVIQRQPTAAFVFGPFSILADRRNWRDLPSFFNPDGVFAKVHIIACGDDHDYRTLEFGSLRIHPVRSLSTRPSLRRLNDAYVLAAGTRLLAKLIEAHEIDLVAQIDATPVKYGLPVVYLARKYGLPSIVTLCNDYDALIRHNASAFERIVQRQLWPYVLTGSTRVRSKGRHIALFAHKHGVPESKIVVIPNKEDLSKFQEVPNKQELSEAAARWGIQDLVDGCVVMITCARLIEAKNVRRMVEAVAAANTASGNLAFLIVGEGPLRPSLEKTARDLGVEDRVRFIGYLPHDELRLAYRLADVFLFPTLYEGHPRALLEAMLSGLPVIASKHGAVHDVVEDGIDGILVDAHDVDQIADAITRLASDRDLRIVLGRHRVFDPSRYSKETIDREEAAFYLETLKAHQDGIRQQGTLRRRSIASGPIPMASEALRKERGTSGEVGDGFGMIGDVWMIIPSFFPLVGGAETQVMRLSAAYREKGWSVQVLTRRDRERRKPRLSRWDIVDGVRVTRISSKGPRVLASLQYLVGGLRVLAREGRRAIYHAHDIGTPGLLALIASRLFGGRSVVKLRTGASVYRVRLREGPTGWILRNVIASHDRIIVVNREVERLLIGLGMPAAKIRRIPNAIDGESFRRAMPAEKHFVRASLGLPSDRKLVLFVGRLVHVKGVDVLMHAWAMLPEEVRAEAALVIVGDGPARPELATTARSLAIEGNVLMTGERFPVRDYYQAADIFALPSRTEGLSNSLLEAMASELPVIATAVGGANDVIEHGISGVLVAPEDPEDLMRALQLLLSGSADSVTMGAQARQRVLEYAGLDVVLAKFGEIYRELSPAVQ